jgi:hypothetical protein
MRTRLALLVLLLVAPTLASAAEVLPMTSFVDYFWANLRNDLQRVVASNPYHRVADAIYLVLATILMIGHVHKIWRVGFAALLPDTVRLVVMLLLVRALMAIYGDFTQLTYDGIRDVGAILQSALIGRSEPLAPLTSLLQQAEFLSIKAPGLSLWNIFDNILRVIGLLSCSITVFAMLIVAGFCQLWGFVGYSLMKLIGLFFLPLVLHERTAVYFDNWLGLFLSFAVYDVLIRTVLSLASRTFGLCFGLVEISSAQLLTVDGIASCLVLLVFGVMVIYALFRCSAFAGSLMGGGSAVSASIARLATFAAKAFA